jgi:hypothetical protein
MLRPRGTTNNGTTRFASSDNNGLGPSKLGGRFSSSSSKTKSTISLLSLVFMLLAFVFGMVVQNYFHAMSHLASSSPPLPVSSSSLLVPPGISSFVKDSALLAPDSSSSSSSSIPAAFDDMIRRAQTQRRHCQALKLNQVESLEGLNDHNAHLSHFGLLDFLDHRYEDLVARQQQQDPYPYQCVLPPEQECEETQFTVIFMAYNPDRLKKMYNQIFKMTSDFGNLVKEVVVVWNGDRRVEDTNLGQSLVDLTKVKPVRISYPLQAGFPNDLFNRYHPRLGITTKAIMYYDDDGPFYSYKAVLGGFEMWKRNSNAQIGAMARKLDLNRRQEKERLSILNGIGDRNFISHCPTDELRYNFNEFAQFGAKMVLPSGSFLHSNYLACLWHPVFTELRQYVQQHPVNPDDGTVSAMVSHLAGRAPKVYSRRINEAQENGQRRLLENEERVAENESVLPSRVNGTTMRWKNMDDDDDDDVADHVVIDTTTSSQTRRRLMDGINWDAGGDHEKKHDWGKLRSDAANSLIRYFGSVNSGSIGWCYGTQYQQGEYCQPDQARVGQLPWLKPDHTAKDMCP